MAQNLDIVLYSKSFKVQSQTILAKLFSPLTGEIQNDELKNRDYLIPEELIAKVYCKLAKIDLSERYTSNKSELDETYGQYPLVLYKNLFITRNNIPLFFKLITQINMKANLSQEERYQAEYLETLIRNKLSIITRLNYEIKSDGSLKSKKYQRFFRNFVNGFTYYFDQQYLRKFVHEYHNLDNFHHRFEIAREIHEKLSRHLGQKVSFFSQRPIVELNNMYEEQIYLERLSSLDIIVYAYIKEQLNNTPESIETRYLRNNFMNLVKFVERVDLFLKQNFDDQEGNNQEVYYAVEDSEQIQQKLSNYFDYDYELMTHDRIVYVSKDEVEDESQLSPAALNVYQYEKKMEKIKKFAITALVTAGFTYLNFTNHE